MNRDPQTRPSLILRVKNAEDSRSWREFCAIYEPLIFNLARKRGLQEADAFDLTQEVFSRVAKSINRWQPNPQRGSFRGWLATITRNLVVEFFRKNRHLPKTSDHSSVQALLNNLPDASAETREFDLEHDRQRFAWAAKRVQSQVEAKTWQAFRLTAMQGKQVAEVASQLRMSKGAVYIARSRVMARLKREVEQAGFDSVFDFPTNQVKS